MAKASSVVASVTQHSRQKSSIVSDRVQRTLEGDMSSDGTTARRADDQEWSVDDVSMPSRRLEHSRQLDAVTRYRWGSDESGWWLCTGRAQARQANGDCHASAAMTMVGLFSMLCPGSGHRRCITCEPKSKNKLEK